MRFLLMVVSKGLRYSLQGMKEEKEEEIEESDSEGSMGFHIIFTYYLILGRDSRRDSRL